MAYDYLKFAARGKILVAAVLLVVDICKSSHELSPHQTSVVAFRSNTNLLFNRKLEDVEYFEADISEYSIRFGKCQYVKMYSDEVAGDEDYETVLALKHFVVFRMCPSDECDTCDEVYGEYVVEVDDYLESTVEYYKQKLEDMCDECEEECNDDGSGCEGCGVECYKYDNMGENGYLDASEYIECQELDVDADDDDFQLFIGPRCSSDGTRIFIGLFIDEDCWVPYTEKSAEDLLGMTLSYHLLKGAYSDESTDCISCMENDVDNNEEDEADEDAVSEMCENVYSASGKCESKHGINGFIQINAEENDFESQGMNEWQVCTFIDSLVWNSYTETGEINIYDKQDEVMRETTTLQKVALSLLTISCFVTGCYAYYLNRKINIEYPPKVNLATQGDGQMT